MPCWYPVLVAPGEASLAIRHRFNGLRLLNLMDHPGPDGARNNL